MVSSSRHAPADAAERLIVALDVPTVARAQELVDRLDGIAGFFKVGMHLQLAEGIDRFLRRLVADGKRLFIDYKFYDIDETVRNAVARAAELGAAFVTVHWSPGTARAALLGKGGTDLKVLCVTLLTSLDRDDAREIYGHDGPLEALVRQRTLKCIEWGLDGVIAAPTELAAIAPLREPGGFAIVTPGIRPRGAAADDQKRIATPRAAIAAGADYLVVGRPIVAQADPAQAARAIVEEMRSGLAERRPPA